MYKKHTVIVVIVAGAHIATPTWATTTCHGATYYSAEHEICMDCPPGFDADTTDGKTSISQCKISCHGGYYPAPSDKYATLEYVHFDNRGDIGSGASTGDNFGKTSMQYKHTVFDTNVPLNNRNTIRAVYTSYDPTYVSLGGNYFGLNSSVPFQLYEGKWRYANQTNYWFHPETNKTHDISLGPGGLVADGELIQEYTPMEFQHENHNSCQIGSVASWDATLYGDIYAFYIYRDDILTHRYTPARRLADNSIGFYDDLTDTFLENQGYGTATGGPESPFYACKPVGAGFWAPESTINYGATDARNACPAGTTTIGYGPGADEAGDCGHILRIGNNAKIYLRSDKKTSPSLCAEINGKTFYANMTPRSNIGNLRTQMGDTIYSIVDDTTATE